MHRIRPWFAFLSLLLCSCVTHSHVDEFSGVRGIRGEPVEYQTTTSYAIHALFIFDLWGDASKSTTLEAFGEEAAQRGATRFRVAQTSSSTYWYIFPPFSFFVHPVVTSVEGDVEGTTAGEGLDTEEE